MKISRRQLRRIITENLNPLDPMSGREAWATKDFSPPDPVTGLSGRERVIYPVVLKRADWVIRDAGLSPDDPALVPMYREAYRWAGQTGTPRIQDIVLKLEDLIAADQRRRNLAQYGQESEEMPPEGLGMSHDVMGEPDPLYESMPDSWKQILGGCLGEGERTLSEMYTDPQAEIAVIITKLRAIDPGLAAELEGWWDGIRFDLYPEPDPYGAMSARRGYSGQ